MIGPIRGARRQGGAEREESREAGSENDRFQWALSSTLLLTARVDEEGVGHASVVTKGSPPQARASKPQWSREQPLCLRARVGSGQDCLVLRSLSRPKGVRDFLQDFKGPKLLSRVAFGGGARGAGPGG